MHDICKAIYIRLDGDRLFLARSGNHKSFAIIQTDEIEDIEFEDEPKDALVPSEMFCTIINKFSDGIMWMGTTEEDEFIIEKGRYRGVLNQKSGKHGFPSEKALFFASKISEIDSGEFMMIDTKQFVSAIRRLRNIPLRCSYNPSLKNLVFDGKSCWAVNHNSYHEIDLNDFPNLNLVIPRELLSVADFIHLSGLNEFKFYEGESHYFFVAADDFFIMEKNGFIAEDERKLFLSELNKPVNYSPKTGQGNKVKFDLP